MIQIFSADFFSVFLNVLAVVLAFLIVISVHELGHFFIARRCNVKVLRLSLGFGKPFWTRKAKSGIEYAVTPFLLGGYVQLLDEREANVPPELLSHSMTRQSVWKRGSILMAGPLMNFFFAMLLFMLVLMQGLPVLKPVVGEVIPSSLAEKSGFLKGDVFLSVQRKPVSNWLWVNFELINAFGEKGLLTVQVQHPNKTRALLTLPLSDWKLDPLRPNLLNSLGIRPASNIRWIKIEKESPLNALVSSFTYVTEYVRMNGVVIYKIVRGELSIRSLAGPFSVFAASAESFKKGWIYYAFFLAFLSVSVGVFNLLPIPGLDGFQILIALVEKITRRPVSTALQLLLYQLGLIALSLLFVQVILNDMARYGKFF